ncbi:hypothetical protein [Streptomyces longwoodensis]|uniref:hypothetical protein n=1 Tax=Streptomyces longwoodensis TaxID=68231 RepID=UPI003818F81B
MRIRTTAASAALLLAALTACGGGGDNAADTKPAPAPPAAASPTPTPGEVEKGMSLGTPARTTGDGGTGVLEITPDTIVFAQKAGDQTPENGLFVVVTMRDKAMTAVAADEPAPISGGGWKWMAADGQMLSFDTGNSSMVTLDGYNEADPVQPGGYQMRSQVFDLTPAQAKGGTLIYIDGEEKAFRWQMPSVDSGPRVADVRKQLAG